MIVLTSKPIDRRTTVSVREREADLVRRLREGDGPAYERLVREHGPRMLAVAGRFLPCPQDAADALQDAFVSAFESIGSFGEDAARARLHRITVNSCLMLLRSRRRRRTVALDELLPQFDASGHHATPISGPDETFSRVETEEQRAQVRQCIRSLPEPHRSVLLLRDIEELDTEQTARLPRDEHRNGQDATAPRPASASHVARTGERISGEAP